LSDQNHDFVSLGLNVGQHRLTISASSVAELVKHLSDLTQEDEIEGTSAISDVLANLELITKAAMVSNGFAGTTPSPASPDGGSPGGYDTSNQPPTCDNHQQPMKWVADGVVKAGQNAGKHYSAWQCSAPFRAGQPKCNMKDFNWK
jgi:hypothetical protein